MPVLVEAISIIIRNETIEEKFPGGWESFVEDVPNNTLCTDGQVACVMFQWPEDAKNYIAHLENYEIKYFENGKAVDLAVVEQRLGPNAPCDWLGYGYLEIDDDPEKPVDVCELKGCPFETLATPENWEYENSLSRESVYVAPGQEDKSLKYLRHENGIDVYLSLLTGEEVYFGRTEDKGGDNPRITTENDLGDLGMGVIDMDKYYILSEMCENDGIHKVLSAIMHIYATKANTDEENEDYAYIRDQLAIAGANIYNHTNEPYIETH